VAQSVGVRRFYDAGLAGRFSDVALDGLFADMVAPDDAGAWLGGIGMLPPPARPCQPGA